MFNMFMSTGLGCSRTASRDTVTLLALKSAERNKVSVNWLGISMYRHPEVMLYVRPPVRRSHLPEVQSPIANPNLSSIILKSDFFYIFSATNITINMLRSVNFAVNLIQQS